MARAPESHTHLMKRHGTSACRAPRPRSDRNRSCPLPGRPVSVFACPPLRKVLFPTHTFLGQRYPEESPEGLCCPRGVGEDGHDRDMGGKHCSPCPEERLANPLWGTSIAMSAPNRAGLGVDPPARAAWGPVCR
jgi:hypothetical protein